MGNNNFKAYRILAVKLNSPFDTKVEPFFDFIVDITTEPSPRQILDKLSASDNKDPLANMVQKVKENIDKVVKFKIYSSKDQRIRQIQIIPNNAWGGRDDFMGIQFRLEDPKLVRDNYCRISQVQIGSPASKARLANDDYLLACEEIKYTSIQELVDSMHEILYSKDITNKTITLISYNIYSDKVQYHRIQLVRKWGGKGIIGCEFLQGHLYKLPNNLSEIRKKYQQRYTHNKQTQAIQKQLLNSDGVSRRLAENLKRKILKKQIVFKVPQALKSVQKQVPKQPSVTQEQVSVSQKLDFEFQNRRSQGQLKNVVFEKQGLCKMYQDRFEYLQKRVQNIQNYIKSLQEVILEQKSEIVHPVMLHAESQTL